MNKAAQQLGRLGGKATSEAKRKANRTKIKAYWADVRAGKVAAPKHAKRRMPNAGTQRPGKQPKA